MTTEEIELSAGTVAYRDTGGDGPVLVLLHGLMMDASLWDETITELAADHRCVAPTLPLGAHRHGMRADADLSLPGVARLVAEFLDRLDLRDVVLVGNDTGGALVQLMMVDGAPRVAGVVLVSCDAFDNFPPGLTGRTLVLSGKLHLGCSGCSCNRCGCGRCAARRSPSGGSRSGETPPPLGGSGRSSNGRRSAVTPCAHCARRRRTPVCCSPRPNDCRASTAPPSSSGRAATA